MAFTQQDLAKFKQLYLSTGQEYAEDMKQQLNLLLEDTQNSVSIHAVRLAAHSLAGQSSVAGYANVAQLSKEIEQLFTNVEEGTATLDKETLQQVQGDVDMLTKQLEDIESE